MTAADVRRAIVRIAHEIVERNHGVDGLAIVGLQRGGTWIAEEIAAQINNIEKEVKVPVGALDVSLHRDDIGMRPVSLGAISNIPFDLSGATVVVVDDVLFDALVGCGFPGGGVIAVVGAVRSTYKCGLTALAGQARANNYLLIRRSRIRIAVVSNNNIPVACRY
jgi:hypothetical protein